MLYMDNVCMHCMSVVCTIVSDQHQMYLPKSTDLIQDRIFKSLVCNRRQASVGQRSALTNLLISEPVRPLDDVTVMRTPEFLFPCGEDALALLPRLLGFLAATDFLAFGPFCFPNNGADIRTFYLWT